jgi:hypothetical protein
MKSLLILAAIGWLSAGCSSSTDNNSTGFNNTGTQPGSLVGRAFLEWYTDDTTHPPLSGIRIQLAKTNYSAITDSFGNWRIDGILAGSYDVLYSKDSFGQYIVYGVSVAGPGTNTMSRIAEPTLSARATETMQLDSVVRNPKQGYIYIYATSHANYAEFFCDTHSDAEPSDGHVATVISSLHTGTGPIALAMNLLALRSMGLQSGDPVYVTGCASNSSSPGYVDAYSNTHPVSPGPKSNVVKFIMP